MRAPPAGRPTQELAGDRPEERRAPTQELDRPPLYFLTLSVSSVCALPLRVTCPRSFTQLVVRRFLRYTHVVSEVVASLALSCSYSLSPFFFISRRTSLRLPCPWYSAFVGSNESVGPHVEVFGRCSVLSNERRNATRKSQCDLYQLRGQRDYIPAFGISH